MRRSLYNFLSSGYFELNAICSLRCFLWFGKAGWYVVTKGRIFFRTSLFFCIAEFHSVNLTSEDFFCEGNL